VPTLKQWLCRNRSEDRERGASREFFAAYSEKVASRDESASGFNRARSGELCRLLLIDRQFLRDFR
jgi:hypothetical protein